MMAPGAPFQHFWWMNPLENVQNSSYPRFEYVFFMGMFINFPGQWSTAFPHPIAAISLSRPDTNSYPLHPAEKNCKDTVDSQVSS
jgi:hypothetical protein